MLGNILSGRYHVIQELGAGGMSQTYLAEDTQMPTRPHCVVKQLKPADPAFFDKAKSLFNREAQILLELGDHDQIPQLLAFFDENQEFYLVQEFIQGHPLTKEIPPSHVLWSESEVRQLLQDVLEILAFVHSQGMIHRDLKPANIMRRDSDGKLVLIDFGAVKQILASDWGNRSAGVTSTTRGYTPTNFSSRGSYSPTKMATREGFTQTVIGTAEYMPLEQHRGGKLASVATCMRWEWSPFKL